MIINRQDTNGVKPILNKAELGYDNYPAGGDAGRLYIGNGIDNIPLAKKSEVDLKAPIDSPTFTGIVTGTFSGNASTATKLATVRSIAASGDMTWDVSFDGSGDVTAVATLADSGITAGTYERVTVDAKGRATAGTVLTADKELSGLSIVNMLYTNGDLTKIRYTNDTDVDYETFSYTNGDLSLINHYIGSVLKGTTTLSYTDSNLVSAIFVEI